MIEWHVPGWCNGVVICTVGSVVSVLHDRKAVGKLGSSFDSIVFPARALESVGRIESADSPGKVLDADPLGSIFSLFDPDVGRARNPSRPAQPLLSPPPS